MAIRASYNIAHSEFGCEATIAAGPASFLLKLGGTVCPTGVGETRQRSSAFGATDASNLRIVAENFVYDHAHAAHQQGVEHSTTITEGYDLARIAPELGGLTVASATQGVIDRDLYEAASYENVLYDGYAQIRDEAHAEQATRQVAEAAAQNREYMAAVLNGEGVLPFQAPVQEVAGTWS
jgi:hypothetical protein